MTYFSQFGQDRFVDEFFNKKTNGVFLDIGANEGVHISSTYFLEKYRNWSGICIEPLPNEFKKLTENRTSINLNIGITDFDGEEDFIYVEGYANMLSGITKNYNQMHMGRLHGEVNHYGGKIHNIKIPVRKLQSVLDEHAIFDVDFCSIDTEGSELSVIKSVNYDKTNIKMFIIENNYKETNVEEFLKTKGYILYKKLEIDDVFVKQNF